MAGVRILWAGPGSVTVNITNAVSGSTATTFTSGGNPVSFPTTISASTTFDTTTLRTYNVSVQYNGTEIATAQGNPAVFECGGDPGAKLVFAPTVPTMTIGTGAPLASPTFTGNPAAPTQSPLDNSTKLATTAYADAAVGVEATNRASAISALSATYASKLVPAYAGNRSGVFDATLGYNVKRGSNLTRLRSALGRVLAGSGGADIALIGDSLTNGWTNAAGNAFSVGVGAWPTYLQKAIAGLTGIPSTSILDGYVRLQSGTAVDSRWVLAGTWNQTIPSFAFSGQANATATYTATVAGTSASIWYYDDASGATWSISVNGASSGAGFASMTNSGPAGVKRKDLSGFASANNLQCKVVTPGAGNMSILGAGIYGNNQLLVHNLGQPGSYAAGSGYGSWTDPGVASAGNFYVTPHNISVANGKTDPDVVFVGLGANDIRTTGGSTVTATKAAVQSIAQAYANSDIVLVASQPLVGTLMTDANWTTYVSALYDLADSLGVPLLDVRNLMGSYTAGVTAGYTTDGQGHYLTFANAQIGMAIGRALL